LKLETLLAALPQSTLGHENQWLFSPTPLPLNKKTATALTRLGHPLAQFQKASDNIYQRSAKGTLPSWISQLLDAGKPRWIIDTQRSPQLRNTLPKIIRPDLILTGNETQTSFALTELDSVPGGMGITLWLSQFYSKEGFNVLGGENGIRDGFQSLLPSEKGGGRILISEESSDYRPEMEYLASQCSKITTSSAEKDDGILSPAYRFFEWFDWKNIPSAKKLAASPHLTPPCKPHLEEKLWLALLHTPSLKKIWQKELRANHLKRLREIIPQSWIVDPTPIPPHAALPYLNAHSWDDVAEFSQKERQLVLKISGFSEFAWGARGVSIGHDMPSEKWLAEIQAAITEFPNHPRMMQKFHSGKIIAHPYFDPTTGEEKTLLGRARLCPYYFTNDSGKTTFGGCLATIVPADKKKIHGMKDAILVPCCVE